MLVSYIRNMLFSQEYIAGRTWAHSMGEAQTDLREGHEWGAEVEGAHVSMRKTLLDEIPPGPDHSREDAADTPGWAALLSWIYQLLTAHGGTGIAWGQWGTWGRDSMWETQRSGLWNAVVSTKAGGERDMYHSFLPCFLSWSWRQHMDVDSPGLFS